MDNLFAFGSKGTERLLKDAHTIATWEVTDFRGEIEVCSLSNLNYQPLFWKISHVGSYKFHKRNNGAQFE